MSGHHLQNVHWDIVVVVVFIATLILFLAHR